MTDSYSNRFDKNKCKNILALIDSKKFNYKHKIGELKYIDINDLVNNVNKTIRDIFAKKGLNILNELKIAGIIKDKNRTPGQKELLNFFDDLLDAILTDKTLKSENQKDDENENKNENEETPMSPYVDDKLFKEYSKVKDLNSYINEFDRATNQEDKEKEIKELKDMGSLVNHKIFILNGNSEYKSKLIALVNAIDYFLLQYSKI